jgi:hypothetical protein
VYFSDCVSHSLCVCGLQSRVPNLIKTASKKLVLPPSAKKPQLITNTQHRLFAANAAYMQNNAHKWNTLDSPLTVAVPTQITTLGNGTRVATEVSVCAHMLERNWCACIANAHNCVFMSKYILLCAHRRSLERQCQWVCSLTPVVGTRIHRTMVPHTSWNTWRSRAHAV